MGCARWLALGGLFKRRFSYFYICFLEVYTGFLVEGLPFLRVMGVPPPKYFTLRGDSSEVPSMHTKKIWAAGMVLPKLLLASDSPSMVRLPKASVLEADVYVSQEVVSVSSMEIVDFDCPSEVQSSPNVDGTRDEDGSGGDKRVDDNEGAEGLASNCPWLSEDQDGDHAGDQVGDHEDGIRHVLRGADEARWMESIP
ncbi:uncharacterized protein G2W53_003397 [Senna tora]|uniref:Uncharacterized protein n=1 Tax=Senna tora TaxID=362788 RepID=A0A834XBH0_9FABA|nr:uncharacterized protein G2W53_003397 [Senna tora]